MKIISALLCILCWESSSLASSGNWVGNGGMVVDCRNSPDPEIARLPLSLLDLVEVVPDKYSAVYPEGTMIDQVNAYIERIAVHAPERAQLYRILAKSFMKNVQFTDNLRMTNDLGSHILPKGCEKMQAIVQYSSSIPERNDYVVDRNIWSRLSEDMKAALVLHEILYYEASAIGHYNKSALVRRFVRATVGNFFASMDSVGFKEFMASHQLGLEFWRDPLTGKAWTLSSPHDRLNLHSIVGCYNLAKGRTPLIDEFREAAPRLFNSPEAARLGLLSERVAFWIYSLSAEGPIVVDHDGIQLPKGEISEVSRTMVCVGEW